MIASGSCSDIAGCRAINDPIVCLANAQQEFPEMKAGEIATDPGVPALCVFDSDAGRINFNSYAFTDAQPSPSCRRDWQCICKCDGA